MYKILSILNTSRYLDVQSSSQVNNMTPLLLCFKQQLGMLLKSKRLLLVNFKNICPIKLRIQKVVHKKHSIRKVVRES